MKTAWTYLFMFVSIPPGWSFREPMIPGFGGGWNGSSPIDENNTEHRDRQNANVSNAKAPRCPIICSGHGSSIIPAETSQ
jgi:hypothetical protein